MIDFNLLKKFSLDMARQAGDIMLEGYHKKISIEHKSTVNDLVTEYDVKVEDFIVQEIRNQYPTHNILTEERGHLQYSDDPFIWVIDPIDGTVNYAHHIPFFCCSIALMQGDDIILGVIYNPITHELFHAIKAQGAYLNGEPIHVSEQNDFNKALMVTGFSYQATQSAYTFPLFQKIVGQNIPIRRLGSAAMDLAYVACGRIDGFWEEGLKPWDIAAGYLIVAEAGGLVTDFYRNPGNIGQQTTWASNGHIHNFFLHTLQEIGYHS